MTDDLVAITSFFSYAKNSYAIKRYKEFKNNLQRQGVKLYTVELAFGDEDFLLDDDVYLRYRSNTVVWQKESLLNSLVKRLPPHIKKVAWLDSDIFIRDDDWAIQLSRMLDQYKLIQIGSLFHFLKESKMNSGVFDKKECKDFPTIGYAFQNDKDNKCNFKKYHVGLGWAANRDFFDHGGLFDYDPTGAGDLITYFASAGLIDHPDASWWMRDIYGNNCKSILPIVNDYVSKIYDYAKGQVSYLETEVTHRYHGPLCRRGYITRLDLLKGINYDIHLQRDSNGLLKWTDNEAGMNKPFEIFFMSKDNHEVKGVNYTGIEKNYEHVT